MGGPDTIGSMRTWREVRNFASQKFSLTPVLERIRIEDLQNSVGTECKKLESEHLFRHLLKVWPLFQRRAWSGFSILWIWAPGVCDRIWSEVFFLVAGSGLQRWPESLFQTLLGSCSKIFESGSGNS